MAEEKKEVNPALAALEKGVKEGSLKLHEAEAKPLYQVVCNCGVTSINSTGTCDNEACNNHVDNDLSTKIKKQAAGKSLSDSDVRSIVQDELSKALKALEKKSGGN